MSRYFPKNIRFIHSAKMSTREIGTALRQQFKLEKLGEELIVSLRNNPNATARGGSTEVVVCGEWSNWMGCLPSKGTNLSKEELRKPDVMIFSEGMHKRHRISGILVYSCYVALSHTLFVSKDLLDDLVLDARGRSTKVIDGDFNACGSR